MPKPARGQERPGARACATLPGMTRRSAPLTPPPVQAERTRPEVIPAALVTLLMVAVMWVQETADQLVFGGRLDTLGILPRTPGTWWHVFTAPFLHGGWAHLMANTVPFAVLAFMSAVRSVGRFLAATLIITVVAGTLVWLFGRPNLHLGASILIFGYFAYLIGVGWWERTPAAIAVAVVTALLYGSILWGVLPTDPRVSFEGHLAGIVGGLAAAAALHRRRR